MAALGTSVFITIEGGVSQPGFDGWLRAKPSLRRLPSCYGCPCDIPVDRKSQGIAGTALPTVAPSRQFTHESRAVRSAPACMERRMKMFAGILLALAVSSLPAAAQDKTITVFAAASMKNALDEIDTAYTAKTGVKVTVSYAASSALAKQIEQGAPADVFISADTDWMDYAAGKKSINEPSRVNLLGNSIVLIAPKDSRIDNVSIGNGFDLAKLAGDGKIATGDVKSVPVGKYAKAALEQLGSWPAAEAKFAMAESVRAALTLVARGEAVLGIVYSTDAKVEPGVKVVGTFPADSHPAIVYPVAATATARPQTTDYLAFLRSTAAKTVLEKYGFKFLLSPTT
jgi:molybdate transport system substrate-binding protein